MGATRSRSDSTIKTSLATRPFIVVGLYVLGLANSVADKVVASIATDGFFIGLLNTFDVSIVVLAAGFVGLRLAAGTPDRAVDGTDFLVGVVYLLGLCMPLSPISTAALTFLALYEYFRNIESPEPTAAATLFLGITVCQLWGGVMLKMFALPILSVDATLVSEVLGLIKDGAINHSENVIDIVGGQSLIILPRCSSLSNISYALLCWLTLVRAGRVYWRKTDLYMMPIVIAGVVVINVLRMTLMGINREMYLVLHGALGANVTNTVTLAMAIVAAWYTLERSPGHRRLGDARP
jgi:hypothetical protein